MPDFTEINRIVKHRYETGAYGSAHFRMTSSFWEAAKALPKPDAAPRLPWDPSPFASLLSIPIVIDDDLSGDEWRLVDTHTEEILYRSGLGGVLGGRVATHSPSRWAHDTLHERLDRMLNDYSNRSEPGGPEEEH